MSDPDKQTADGGAPIGAWKSISPSYGLRPDWHRSATPRRWPVGLALLFLIGIGGAFVLLLLAQTAASVGFENTLTVELARRPAVEQFVLVTLLVPVIEEFLFRLPLARRPHLGVLAIVGAIGVANFAFGNGPTLVVAALFGTVLIGCAVLWGQSKFVGTRAAASMRRSWSDAAARWWEANPSWPVWISVMAFGLVHLSNFDVSWSGLAVVVAPLVVSPQLWLGLMFTIARVRYGWWAGLVLHAVHNCAVWGVSTSLFPTEAA